MKIFCIFYRMPSRKIRKTVLKNFWTNSNIPTNRTSFCFSKMRKFQQGSDSELAEQPLDCIVPTRCTNIDEKQTLSPHRGVWGGQHGGLQQVPGGRSAVLDWEDSASSKRSLEPVSTARKFLQPHQPLIIMRRARLARCRQNSQQHKKMNWRYR